MSRDQLWFSVVGGLALLLLVLAWCEPEPRRAPDSLIYEVTP